MSSTNATSSTKLAAANPPAVGQVQGPIGPYAPVGRYLTSQKASPDLVRLLSLARARLSLDRRVVALNSQLDDPRTKCAISKGMGNDNSTSPAN